MRISLIVIFLAALSPIINAQNFIKYKTHALEVGYKHLTQKIENIDEGMSGDKCFWDFSNLTCGDASESNIIDANELLNPSINLGSNIVISKGEQEFFYSINEEKLEYNGYKTEDAIIQFTQPIIKMNYPFKYKDSFEGMFSGTGLHYNVVETSIEGTYLVDADGKGTLILPNGTNINNAFRVKSVEHYFETGCKTIEWKITKYLWYTKDHRYPVFAVIQTDIDNGDNKKTSTKNGYYSDIAIKTATKNSNAISQKLEITLYPNPATDNLKIKYSLPETKKTSIFLYNSTGVKMKEFISNQMQVGNHEIDYNITNKGINPGVYYVQFIFDKEVATKKIIINKP